MDILDTDHVADALKASRPRESDFRVRREYVIALMTWENVRGQLLTKVANNTPLGEGFSSINWLERTSGMSSLHR